MAIRSWPLNVFNPSRWQTAGLNGKAMKYYKTLTIIMIVLTACRQQESKELPAGVYSTDLFREYSCMPYTLIPKLLPTVCRAVLSGRYSKIMSSSDSSPISICTSL